MKNPDVIARLLEGILVELKEQQYQNNVSVPDIEEIFKKYINAFDSLTPAN